ncbi:MAG: hypothetical protein LBO69_04965 [Ignavibacteria bacterium]|jgi:hypothetical protein|nr:hypothetical protein [Ignavibacteria bacterium]
MEFLISQLPANIDDLVNTIFRSTNIPIAIFDHNGTILSLCKQTQYCKCYNGKNRDSHSTLCGLHEASHIGNIIKQIPIDEICELGSHITSKLVNISGDIYTIVAFQYMLSTDKSIEDNTAADTNIFNNKYSWLPTKITSEERDVIMDYVDEQLNGIITRQI